VQILADDPPSCCLEMATKCPERGVPGRVVQAGQDNATVTELLVGVATEGSLVLPIGKGDTEDERAAPFGITRQAW